MPFAFRGGMALIFLTVFTEDLLPRPIHLFPADSAKNDVTNLLIFQKERIIIYTIMGTLFLQFLKTIFKNGQMFV